MKPPDSPTHTKSSGNVFADLQVADPVGALAKSELAAIVSEALRGLGLTQVAAARRLGIDQPKVSELLRGRLTRFSTERLLLLLLKLGRDVEIVIRGAEAGQRSDRPGRLHIRDAGRRSSRAPLADAHATRR